jgi:hypothetical protein
MFDVRCEVGGGIVYERLYPRDSNIRITDL